jgi:hypothetical protein
MALFSSKKQSVTNTTNVDYSPTEISTTVGPTVSESTSSYTSFKTTDIADAFNTVGSYNRTFSLNQPVFVAGAGSEALMQGTGLDLGNFFDAPAAQSSGASPAPGVPLWQKIAVAALVAFVVFKLIRR